MRTVHSVRQAHHFPTTKRYLMLTVYKQTRQYLALYQASISAKLVEKRQCSHSNAWMSP